MSDIGGIAADRLRQFIERIERLEAEIKELNADKSDIYKEAKALGFDVKAMRALVAERRKEPHELAEMGELLDLYRAAMDSAAAMPSRARAHEGHDPETGEVVENADKVAKFAAQVAADPYAVAYEIGAVAAIAEERGIDLTIPASLRRSA